MGREGDRPGAEGAGRGEEQLADVVGDGDREGGDRHLRRYVQVGPDHTGRRVLVADVRLPAGDDLYQIAAGHEGHLGQRDLRRDVATSEECRRDDAAEKTFAEPRLGSPYL